MNLTTSNSLFIFKSFRISTSDPTVPNLGRYCGRRLNCYTNSAANTIIYSSYVPFIVQVDFNGNEANADNKNRGFSVNYRQVLC